MACCVEDDFSSDGWEEDNWKDYVILPDGYELVDDVPDTHMDRIKYLREHFLRQKYPSGHCKFSMCCVEQKWRWVVIKRMLKWEDICKFPKGHELRGVVEQGQEMQSLQKHYKEKYVIDKNGAKYEVKQRCPCGKTECETHIFPSQVQLEFSRTLAIVTPPSRDADGNKVDKKITPIEPIFRKQHAMTHDEAKTFFEQFQLNWKIFITTLKITFWMLCKCGQAFEATPCNKCYNKLHRKCHICDSIRRKRMLKKCHASKNCTNCTGICSDCKAAEISFCEHCNKDIRLDHECVSLVNQHWGLRKNPHYPRFVRQKFSKMGYCIDCKKVMHENAYPRHHYRAHNDLSPCDLYDREYKKHYCNYCFHYEYDTTKITNHMKMHSLKKTHICKAGCGMAFTHAASEIKHRRKMHNYVPLKLKHHRRVGSRIVLREAKKQKI